MTRWVIKADGRTVAYDYGTEQDAWCYARFYEYHCMNQDDPFDPEMTVEKEEAE